jgi:hypothetical protein
MNWGATESRGSWPGRGRRAAAARDHRRHARGRDRRAAVGDLAVARPDGPGRGGAYSYDWIERRFGVDIHNVDRVVPELKNLKVGDEIPMSGYAMRVEQLDKEQALVIRSSNGAWVWTFELRPTNAHTRLISRNRFDTSAWKAKDWLGYPIMEPGSWLNNSITGADVKNKSLTAADIKGRLQGPPGARGATGPAGAPGPVGPPGIQRLVSATASKFVPIDAVDSVVALFPAGMVAVSGGSTPTPTDSSSRRPRRAPAGSSDSTRGTGASAERSLQYSCSPNIAT